MTWNELIEFAESLSAEERKGPVEIRPDAAMSYAELQKLLSKLESVLSLSCCMPAVGGYPKPCLMFMGS